MKHLNKSDLINDLAREFGDIPHSTINDFIKKLVAEITRTLAKGDKIAIREFGSLKPTARKEYTGHNPKTGNKVVVPARTRIIFKASKKLLSQVNSNS